MFVSSKYSTKIGWRSVRRSHSNLGLKVLRFVYLLITAGSLLFIYRLSGISLSNLIPIKYDCGIVDGVSTDSNEWCKTAIGILKQKNIIFTSGLELRSLLVKQFPGVRDLVLVKRFPFSLSLTIYGRVPLAKLRILKEMSTEATTSGILRDEEVILLDDLGSILNKEMYVVADNLPIIVDTKEPKIENGIVGGGGYLSILNVISKLKKESILISSIDATSYPDLKIYLLGNIIVHLIVDSRLNSQLGVLQMIFGKYKIEGKMLRSVDLRFSEPVVSW